jgi:hypothetical protein
MKIERFDEMITTRDNLFYTPTVAGPEGKLPIVGQNYGADPRIKTYKEFAGEFRKGSNKFGKLLNLIMEFLRLPEFKNKIEENDGIKFEIKDFEIRSHIDVEKIKQLLNNDNNLYSFNITIDDKFISFTNIKKTYKDRYVSGRKD